MEAIGQLILVQQSKMFADFKQDLLDHQARAEACQFNMMNQQRDLLQAQSDGINMMMRQLINKQEQTTNQRVVQEEAMGDGRVSLTLDHIRSLAVVVEKLRGEVNAIKKSLSNKTKIDRLHVVVARPKSNNLVNLAQSVGGNNNNNPNEKNKHGNNLVDDKSGNISSIISSLIETPATNTEGAYNINTLASQPNSSVSGIDHKYCKDQTTESLDPDFLSLLHEANISIIEEPSRKLDQVLVKDTIKAKQSKGYYTSKILNDKVNIIPNSEADKLNISDSVTTVSEQKTKSAQASEQKVKSAQKQMPKEQAKTTQVSKQHVKRTQVSGQRAKGKQNKREQAKITKIDKQSNSLIEDWDSYVPSKGSPIYEQSVAGERSKTVKVTVDNKISVDDNQQCNSKDQVQKAEPGMSEFQEKEATISMIGEPFTISNKDDFKKEIEGFPTPIVTIKTENIELIKQEPIEDFETYNSRAYDGMIKKIKLEIDEVEEGEIVESNIDNVCVKKENSIDNIPDQEVARDNDHQMNKNHFHHFDSAKYAMRKSTGLPRIGNALNLVPKRSSSRSLKVEEDEHLVYSCGLCGGDSFTKLGLTDHIKNCHNNVLLHKE